MSLLKLEQFCAEAGTPYRKNEPMREHCTFKTGGPAELFIEPEKIGDAKETIRVADAFGVRLFVLGNGSNVIFSDDGFSGAIMRIGAGISSMRIVEDDLIECESGTSLKALTVFACENSLSGLEFAYGIPGSVGGAVYMNAGAYDGEMKDVLVKTYHIDKSGAEGSFSGKEMDLGYRHSVYTGGEFLITKALFRLTKGDKSEIRAKMEDFMKRRRDKQPLELPSAGSAFKRPVGGYASELIDRCGLKGKCVGGAMVSEKHAGFIVNAGGATSNDILKLIEFIQKEVREKTGIELEPEIRMVK